MSKGYVYVLSNPSMPGLLKVGQTTNVFQKALNWLEGDGGDE